MIKLRIALARWILGKHCTCYKLGYHKLNDYNTIAKDKIKAKNEQIKSS
jgi:hypothetical protein